MVTAGSYGPAATPEQRQVQARDLLGASGERDMRTTRARLGNQATERSPST